MNNKNQTLVPQSMELEIEKAIEKVIDETDLLISSLPADFFEYLANSFEHYFNKGETYEPWYITQTAHNIMNLNAKFNVIKDTLDDLHRLKKFAVSEGSRSPGDSLRKAR